MLISNRKFKIGGEFDIDAQLLNNFNSFEPEEELFLYSSGRTALMAILSFIAKTKPSIIYIPYYICSSVVNACIHAGFQILFYELNDNYLFPQENLTKLKPSSTLLTVNYFGFVNDNLLINNIKELRPDITTISDQVQSFWTLNDSLADFSFTSLRKHIPTPDGALVHTTAADWNNNRTLPENSFYHSKLIGAILKNQKVADNVYLHYFEEGEDKLNTTEKITKSSSLSYFLYQSTDWKNIKEKRVTNYKYIYDFGTKNGIDFLLSYKADIVPLCVPILVKNRDVVRKKLIAKGIFLPIHWPLSQFNKDSNRAKKMAQNEISLVVDQRYSEEEMGYQMNCLISII